MDISKEMDKIIYDTTIWTPATFAARTILFHQNSDVTQSYYIKKGIIKVYNDQKGEKAIINLFSDKTFLPFDNFSDKTSLVSMKTIEKTELYIISDANYRKLLANNPVFKQIAEQSSRDMMHSMMYRTLALWGEDAMDKYKTAFEYYPCIQRMSNVEIGNLINTTSKTVSDIKKAILKEKRQNGEKGRNISR